MKKIVTIPTLIGILFLLAGIATGLILIQNTKTFRIGASVEGIPKDVRITNISDSSFSVSWFTSTPTTGVVKYGEGNSQTQTAISELPSGTTQYVNVKNLKPSTLYSFKIMSGGVEYDTQGNPWQVTTPASIGISESNIIISGNIKTATDTPAKGVLVYAQIPDGTSLSTFTSSEGNWLMPISSSRALPSLTSFATIDAKKTVIDIFVQAGVATATAKTTGANAQPAPPITLGQTFDFVDTKKDTDNTLPESNLNLPVDSVSTSKFVVTEASGSATGIPVTLESHIDGETITVDSPQFFGDGPPGTTITLTVESDPITQTVQVDAKGDWKWDVPADLPAGPHKLTISWRGVDGILRTLTRTFEVQAAEGPAFEASASASTTPTPTIKPTITPTPTTVATPSATIVSTSMPIPVTGSLTPTIVLFMMGIGVLFVSAVLAFKAL